MENESGRLFRVELGRMEKDLATIDVNSENDKSQITIEKDKSANNLDSV